MQNTLKSLLDRHSFYRNLLAVGKTVSTVRNVFFMNINFCFNYILPLYFVRFIYFLYIMPQLNQANIIFCGKGINLQTVKLK